MTDFAFLMCDSSLRVVFTRIKWIVYHNLAVHISIDTQRDWHTVLKQPPSSRKLSNKRRRRGRKRFSEAATVTQKNSLRWQLSASESYTARFSERLLYIQNNVSETLRYTEPHGATMNKAWGKHRESCWLRQTHAATSPWPRFQAWRE